MNVFQAFNSPSVQQSHKPAHPGARARPLNQATKKRSLRWLRNLAAFLVVTVGVPGRNQNCHLAPVASTVMAADLPGSPQEPSRHPQPPQGPGPSEAAPPLSQKQKKDLL